MTRGELLIIFAIVLVGITWYIGQYAWKEYTLEREIRSGQILHPLIDKNKPIIIHFGSVTLVQTYNQLQDGVNLRSFINTGCDYPIQILFEEGKMLVTVNLINIKGETVIQISKSGIWVITDDKFLAYDRNYNDNAVEVVNMDNKPVFQVKINKENDIMIGGVFYMKSNVIDLNLGNGVYINPSTDADINIAPIFRYPSKIHLGELYDNSILAQISEFLNI